MALVGLVLSACEETPIGPEVPDVGGIELSQQIIEVEFEPGSYTVQVTSLYSWDAVSKNSWIIIESETGIAGTKELTFKVERNEEADLREGTIVIKNENYNLIAELYVIQKGAVYEIEMGCSLATTRGIINTNDDMTYPISVSATWNDPAAGKYVPYFENHEFVYNAQTELWKGSPTKYWPTSGNMQFLAVCPYSTKVTNTYSVEGKFESATFGTVDNNLMEQHDVLFSDLLEVSAPQTSAQPLLFHHACAQLNVTFKKTDSAATVVLKSVSAEDVNLTGILTVTPVSGGTSTAVWQVGLPNSRYFLDDDAAGVEDGTLDAVLTAADAFSPKPLLVVPSAQTEFVIVYTIDGVEHTYTHKLTEDWKMGYKYTYNYTINVNEIIFDCTVDEWKPAEGGNITI